MNWRPEADGEVLELPSTEEMDQCAQVGELLERLRRVLDEVGLACLAAQVYGVDHDEICAALRTAASAGEHALLQLGGGARGSFPAV